MTQFTVSFNIGPGNAERQRAFELYQKAFHVKKFSTSTPPDCDDLHISMDVYGLSILIGPGNPKVVGLDAPVICEVRFDDLHEFEHAYTTLKDGCCNSALEGPYPWADRLGLISDAFGIGWALYYNA